MKKALLVGINNYPGIENDLHGCLNDVTNVRDVLVKHFGFEPEEALKRPGVNAEPEPLGGSSLFKSYLDNNARYPESADSKRKEIVKIRFRVSKTGDPSNFFIERSPGDAFSQEAIRLIKNGPKWSPQIKDGLPVDGEVSVRITFKP